MFQLQRHQDLDPGRQRAHAARPGAAHAGGGRGGGAVAHHDQPHLGGEDAAVPAARGDDCRQQAVQGHGGRAHEDLPDGGHPRLVQGELRWLVWV